MQAKITYKFSSILWRHSGSGGWVFVSFPKDISKEIREHLQWQEEGWGRMRAVAIINNSEWETAIWYDTKMETYLLPVKAQVRKKEDLKIDSEVKVTVKV